jgi:putative heme-binding domain-containing protein
VVDYSKSEGTVLVENLLSENAFASRHAQRILQERAPTSDVLKALEEELAIPAWEKSEADQLHLLWTVHAIGWADGLFLQGAMGDKLEYVRAWAVQLSVEDKKVEPDTLGEMEKLAENDQSPVVRLYLASALQRLPLDQRWTIAQNLAQHAEDAKDHNIPLMIWYGIEPLVAADTQRAFDAFASSPIPTVARFVVRRAAADPMLHAELVQALADPKRFGSLGWMLEECAHALKDQRNLKMPEGWAELYPKLALASDSKVHEFGRQVALAFGDPSTLPAMRATLADAKASPTDRTQALDALVRAKDVELGHILRTVLDDSAMRGAAIRALANFDDVEAAAGVIASYGHLGTEDKRDALNTLSSRTSYATLLLDAVDSQKLERRDLGAFVVRKIESLGDETLSNRIHTMFGRVRETSETKKARIAELKGALGDEKLSHASRARGREVFSRTCMQCHTLFGAGGKVGPDLTGSNRADLDYLLSNVVDPNAVVGKDYLATMVWTHDERLITGIQKAETDSSITLQSENEQVVVAKDDIAEKKLSDISTMPEGLLETLKPEEILDLVAYLRGDVQSPIAVTQSNAAKFFDGATLANWRGDPKLWSVENGEIVGKTTGIEHNQFLISDYELGDFKLSLDVKLVGDAGNSGVQFRSAPLESGEIRGYQADVGPGWWGKLYEEEGRALLWDKSGEEHVHKGDWNHYEIEARGHRVRTWLNGSPCVDLEDPQGALTGVTALQLHSGGATEVRFKNLKLELAR